MVVAIKSRGLQRALNHVNEASQSLINDAPTHATVWGIQMHLRQAANIYRKNVPEGTHFISIEAQRQEIEAKQNGTPFTKVDDHSIPLSMLYATIKSKGITSPQEIMKLLPMFSTVTRITPEEDARLRAAGLVKKMPAGWDGKDPFARYKAVGIDILPV